MATLRILVPDGTTNYVKNPSARYATTGWTAVGSTLTRTLDYARFGIASLKVVTSGAALYEGIYYRVNALAGISDPITVSAYMRGTGQVRIRLIDNPFGQERASLSVTLRADRWTRLEVTGFSTGSNDMRLYVETTAVKAVTFYVDGAQMERKPYATSYCDGDQDGCRWNIIAHNSHSIRDPYSRAGGRWVELAGPEQSEKNLYMTVAGGMGVAPIVNNLQSYADAPGSYYQNTKILARPVTFTFHAKHEQRTRRCSETTLASLHQLRQILIDVIKPDKTRGGEEFILEYTDGDYPVYLRARYDGGLEGEWDVRNEWINSFPLRILAVSPFFYEDNQNVNSLDFQEWDDVNQVISRVDGQWSNMNFGVNSALNGLALGSRGEVIAVGSFTRANSDVTAIDPLIPANYIAYWDGEKWNQYGIGADNWIFSVAVAPNGYIYVGGAFTSIGGVAANRVAYWDGSAWNAMGSGLNGNGYAIAVAPDGHVYVGGNFTTAGGNQADYIAHWDGGTWHPVGDAGGLNAIVRSIVISQNGLFIYAGGDFTDEFSNPGSDLNYIAQYNTLTGLWEALGDGFDALVWQIKLSPSGILYAAGNFTLSGTQTINYIGYWNGATWIPLGSGTDTAVFAFDVYADGELLAVGNFTEAGGVEAGGVAIWNGSTWTNLDVTTGSSQSAALYDARKNIYMAASDPPHAGPVRRSGVTYVPNVGTAETNPKLYISGPATLKYIENYTASKRVYLDLAILSGEEIFIDFGRGKVESTVRGDLSYTVLPGSDMRAFTLLPGQNKIIAFMIDDLAAQMQLSYTPRHWSADSTARGEEL